MGIFILLKINLSKTLNEKSPFDIFNLFDLKIPFNLILF